MARPPAGGAGLAPRPGAWSAHEILCHCADAEANSYARIRFLVAEVNPVIRAFDENRWAQAVDYHALPAETALSVVEALRAHTDALVRRLPEDGVGACGHPHRDGPLHGRAVAAHQCRAPRGPRGPDRVQSEPVVGGGRAGVVGERACARRRRTPSGAPLIEQYAAGAARLRAAWAAVPPEARQWRPAPGEWSAHEVVCHTADSETNAYARIRFLVAQDDPVIQGYDQEHWVSALDYAALSAESAMAAVEAVRGHTAAFIRRLPESAWRRAGTHSESGPYSGDDWLHIYSVHLDDHARQIEENVASFRRQHS